MQIFEYIFALYQTIIYHSEERKVSFFPFEKVDVYSLFSSCELGRYIFSPVNLEVERPIARWRFLHVTLFHGKQRSITVHISIRTRRGDDDGRGFIADAAKYRAKCLGLGFYSRSSI